MLTSFLLLSSHRVSDDRKMYASRIKKVYSKLEPSQKELSDQQLGELLKGVAGAMTLRIDEDNPKCRQVLLQEWLLPSHQATLQLAHEARGGKDAEIKMTFEVAPPGGNFSVESPTDPAYQWMIAAN